ncbi:MAG: NADH-quinone oxidoreductase subunit NuoF [Dehalococcoidales bacterium]|nr:NADH-quinone oxidoreductase subunit NuoF [Dehalococcoidales bacterium]
MGKVRTADELLSLRQSISEKIDPNKPCVRICMTGCRAYGAIGIRDAFNEEIRRRGLEDKVEVRETGCHGFCARAPVTVVDPQDIFYQQITVDDVADIVDKTLVKGDIVDRLVYVDPVTGGKIPFAHDVPFYKGQTKNVLRKCGIIDPTNVSHYIVRDGYSALSKVLTTMTSEQVIETVEGSGLRGRGGAGFPTGRKWRLVRNNPGDIKYLVCNGDEGDPGAFMDRAVLEGDPHSVLEGMLIAAYAIGAKVGYIYVRAEYPIAVEHLKVAISQAEELGFLGKNILDSEFNFEIRLKEGAGAFVCGEETALLMSVEGKRGMPRPRPPFPAQSGLWGKPTNINNVETYANITSIILNGADWYSKMGTETSKGTKIFSLAGKINNTGLVEVPIGSPMRDVIFDIGGGIPKGRKFKAVQMGGPSGGCVPEAYLDLPIDYGSLQAIGSIMGSGGMIVMDENTCAVDIARYFLSFIQTESCGKCTPCRLGTKVMLDTLTRITQGEGSEKDIELLESLANQVRDTSLCGLGRTCPNPVLTTIRYFRDEYEAHIKEKRCPAASCETLVYAPCEHVCPVNVDAVGYIALIAEGRFEEALNLIRQRNPLPGVCGQVCNHPCEVKCKRGDIDEPIAIASLKRFVADYERGLGIETKVAVGQPKYEKVAIVGSGPAGLTSAFHLAKQGYKVTIFEVLPVAGGMLVTGIPEYRLPREVVHRDIEFITSLGVEIKTNTPIGKDLSIDGLLEQGYKAIFIAIGAHKGQRLGIPGDDLEGVFDGVSFLRDMNLGKNLRLKGKVVVIGGGNVAIDAARSALRLGAEEVSIVYRRSRQEMPANMEEIAEAEYEGVKIVYLAAPTGLLGKNGKVKSMECIRMELGEYDASGRRRPIAIEGSEFSMELDTVITAIGQTPDLSFLPPDNGLEITKRQTFVVDPVTMVTSRPGIFAGGDVVTGPATVIEAIAAGERAAISIHRYLRGKDMNEDRLRPPETRVEIPRAVETPEEKERVRMPTLPLKRRLNGFEEINLGYSTEMAVEEAKRCLRCDLER